MLHSRVPMHGMFCLCLEIAQCKWLKWLPMRTLLLCSTPESRGQDATWQQEVAAVMLVPASHGSQQCARRVGP